MVEPAVPSTPAALAGAGLYVTRDPRGDGHEAYVISGRTYDHRKALKDYGGRWSDSRKVWVFEDRGAIERLCVAFGGQGLGGDKSGFAEASSPFQPSRIDQSSVGTESSEKEKERPHFHGHRKRLRARFLEQSQIRLNH